MTTIENDIERVYGIHLKSLDGSPTYELVEHHGEVGIKCRRCTLTSWNQNDVAHKYCGRCHSYHTPRE
jgi:hypothetical protein